MLPLVVLVIVGWVFSVYAQIQADYQYVIASYQKQVITKRVAWLASALDEYHTQYGVYPSNLSVLTSNAFYAQTKSWSSPWIGYATTNDGSHSMLNDGWWRYHRASIFEAFPKDYGFKANGMKASDVSATNKYPSSAGTNFFTDNYSWSAKNDITWWRGEDRSEFMNRIAIIRVMHQRTSAKILTAFSASQTLPSASTMTNIAGSGGLIAAAAAVTAANCSGVYSFPAGTSNILMDCDDLIVPGVTGGEYVGYRALTAKRFALQSPSGIIKNDGTLHYVTTFVDLP